ncbi:MAG: VOC family protein [Fibrobacter sp.]|jgi:PhnB protein|nr:VOC family protein [Fibrobacter sp.]
MTFELFINFNGNCREAVEFYAKVFKSEHKTLMTYGEAPADPNHPLPDSDRDRIMYGDVKIGDKLVMFMDMPSAAPCVIGNNINPTINTADKNEIDRLFNELSEGGTVFMKPQKTFFSKYYAMLTDKFGITWHILSPEEQ